MNLVTHFHLAPNVKNVWSCTSTYLYVFTAWCLIKHRICLHGMVLTEALEHLYPLKYQLPLDPLLIAVLEI